MSDLAAVFSTYKAELAREMTEFMQATIPVYKTMPATAIQQQVLASFASFEQDIAGDSAAHYANFWRGVSYERATQGRSIESVLQILKLDRSYIVRTFKQHFSADLASQLEAVERTHTILETGIGAIYHGYAQLQTEVIDQQGSILQELSTPIVPIHEGVLVLPLIGNIDSRRATQIMEDLLEQISISGADVVILDITGVPVIDTGVANYILQTARAVRLLGSQVVLVGIGADIAQTIVQLGIDLNTIVTRANLRAGFEYALNELGYVLSKRLPAELNARTRLS
jgi:rsbT co-antagonist protein RsbR